MIMKRENKKLLFGTVAGAVGALLLMKGCSGSPTPTVKEVTKTVTVEKTVTVPVEVVKYSTVVKEVEVCSDDKKEHLFLYSHGYEHGKKTGYTKHRVSLYGGVAPRGMESGSNGNTVTVKQESGAVAGVGYSYSFTKKFSVEAAVLTNGSYLGGVGINW